MSEEPTPLRVAEREPDAGLVALLREVLRRAEAGEYVAIAFAAQRVGGEVERGTAIPDDADVFALLGAMRFNEFVVMSRIENG